MPAWSKRSAPAPQRPTKTNPAALTAVDDTPPYENWVWANGPLAPGPIVLVDIDGVISDASQRQHFLEGDTRDWKGFFLAAEHDEPLDSFVEVLNVFDRDLAVVLLTARPDYLREITIEWLGSNGIRWDALILRGRRDGRLQSPDFKRRSVRELHAKGYEIRVAFDDDKRNVQAFVDEGLRAVYVHSGYYE